MTRARDLAAAALPLLFLAAGCGPGPASGQQAQATLVAQPAPPPPPNYSGYYRGPNVLLFAVTQPMVRDMPPEEQMGSVSVMDSGGPTITIEARMFEGGDACRIELQRSGTRAVAAPGARCASRLFYDGVPVIAMVQVESGEADFAGGVLRMILRGPFVGEVLIRDRTLPVGGRAVWRFEGRR